MLKACRCMKALVEISPLAYEFREAEIHLILLNSVRQWTCDVASIESQDSKHGAKLIILQQIIKIGVHIISLMDDKETSISLLNHGITNNLIYLTESNIIDSSVWESISRIIYHVSDLSYFDDDDIDDNNDDIMRRYNELMFLGRECLQLGLDDDNVLQGPNPILDNTCQFLANMVELHGHIYVGIMNDLPRKSLQRMIQILPLTQDIFVREGIMDVLKIIILRFGVESFAVDTLINECDLFDALQQTMKLSMEDFPENRRFSSVFTILARLLVSASYATKIFNEYPQIIAIIMNSFTSRNKYDHIASIDCLNSLLQNINNNLLFLKSNFIESLCLFLQGLKEDFIQNGDLDYWDEYLSFFDKTGNALTNMKSNWKCIELEKYEIAKH